MDVKYPRTYHVPGSPGTTSDDRICAKHDWLFGLAQHPVVVTEKMDGENTTMTNKRIYARSVDSVAHPSRSYVRSVWATTHSDIPAGWRVCGENMYAKHSIYYPDLEDWFLVFGIWDEHNNLLPWDSTVQLCGMLQLTPVPVLGYYNTGVEAVGANRDFDTTVQEGFVLRHPGNVGVEMFDALVLKWVRERHVNTSDHWMYQEVTPNGLRKAHDTH